MKQIRLSSVPPETKAQRAERLKAAREAEAQTRQRIKELEANLSPEGKAQWDEICGRGKTDPTLEARKRERILIKAMMSGEVLPSASWIPQGFQIRLADLDEEIRHAEEWQRAKEQEEADRREVEMLTNQQKQVEFFLRLLFKFTADDSIRQGIESKTRQCAEKWQKWKESEWIALEDGTYRPKSFKQLADGIQQTLDGYAEMCNTYAKMPCNVRSIQEWFNHICNLQNSMKDDMEKSAYKGAKEGAKYAISHPLISETGRERRHGGGAKRKWDINGEQCKALWDLMQRGNRYKTAAAAADAVIRRECPKSINPFVYMKGMKSKDKNMTRTKFLKRFRGWCKENGKQYPFDATE